MNANITLNIRQAARQVRRNKPTRLTCTAAELDAHLGALGCQVDAEGNFNVRDLLRAIRVNVEPIGLPEPDNTVADQERKLRHIARRWCNAARP